jgi:hypothetical protein
MKKIIFLFMLSGLVSVQAFAQDDDLYFTPKSTVKTEKAVDNTPTYYRGSNRDVDEYNRRGAFRSHYQVLGSDSAGNDVIRFVPGEGVYPDTTYVDSSFVYSNPGYSGDDDYYYTRRMSRWDGFYDPWFYGYYGPWYWRAGWYDPWYWGYYDPWYYGWYDPWYYAWYDPWYYGYGWGWYGPWHHGWYGGWYDPWYYGGGWYAGGGHFGGRNSGGVTGRRTWSGRDFAGGRVPGSTYGRGTTTGTRTGYRGNRYTSRSSSNRAFGGRSNVNRSISSPSRSSSWGSTRSSSFGGSSSFGRSGGSFGGGHVGGGFGGGHVGGGGGGGHFGGGRR